MWHTADLLEDTTLEGGIKLLTPIVGGWPTLPTDPWLPRGSNMAIVDVFLRETIYGHKILHTSLSEAKCLQHSCHCLLDFYLFLLLFRSPDIQFCCCCFITFTCSVSLVLSPHFHCTTCSIFVITHLLPLSESSPAVDIYSLFSVKSFMMIFMHFPIWKSSWRRC